MEHDDLNNMTNAEWRALTSEGRRTRRKVSEDTWVMIRRGWEQGETGQSLAKRFDVGLANLWRRRQSENWRRPAPEDRRPEPVEGWMRHTDWRMRAFETQLATERMIAERLVEAMRGEVGGEMPLWHLGFIMHRRAETLGEAAARADWERHRERDWAACVWEDDGTLRPLHGCDHALMRAHRQDLLEELDLPEAAARWLPGGAALDPFSPWRSGD